MYTMQKTYHFENINEHKCKKNLSESKIIDIFPVVKKLSKKSSKRFSKKSSKKSSKRFSKKI